MSDSSDSEAPAPARSKSSKSSTRSFEPPRDSQLSKLLQKHKNKRDREDTARTEANTNRVAAMDGNSRKGKGAVRRPPPPPAPARKSLGTLIWFVEGPEAFDDAPLPSKKHLATMKSQGFSVSAAESDDLKVNRNWTYEECLAFLKKRLPVAYAATADAINAWKEAYPDEDAPPFFHVLSQTNKKLSVSPCKQPTGADLQEMFTSASNWYDRRLYITSGVDVSLYPDDEINVYRPCALSAELEAVTHVGEEEDQDESNAASAAEDGDGRNAVAEKDNKADTPPATIKRKRVQDGSPPATCATKRQRNEPPIIISDDDATPIAGPSSAPAYAVSTLIVTGFKSPPKRNRVRVAEGPQ